MSADPIKFLRAVLPEEGKDYYSLASPYRRKGKPNKIEFRPTIEELWNLQQSYLDRGDVFFFTCTFKVPDKDNATGENVSRKRAFYLDLDFDPDDAAKEIEELVGAIKLPDPILIASGRGLHAWWPLTESIGPDYWLRIAKGLKGACETFWGLPPGIRIDHGVTANPVRLGRCPGTFNYKYGAPREIRFYKEPSFDAHDISVFDKLAVGEPEKPAARSFSVGDGDKVYYQSMLEALVKRTKTYKQAVDVGMALHTLGWKDGYQIWQEWYRRTPEAESTSAVSDEELEKKWIGFNAHREGGLTAASLNHWATEAGWDWRQWAPRSNGSDSSPLPNGEDRPALNGFDAGDPLAVHWHAMSEIKWIKIGKPQNEVIKQREYVNARKAVAEVQIKGRYDYFTNCREFLLPWEEEKGWQDFSDDKKQIGDNVRNYLCDHHYGDMGIENVERALREIANYGSYNSIVDYLDNLEWKGEHRIDTWLIKYCHAEDTPLNRAISELVLIAAVRRARKPGSKFDHLLILEGNEGIGKSRAVQILAGDEKYFSDAPILTLDAKRQHELLEGKWFYEISEFHGIRRTESDHLKAFVTRNVDRSRKAYAHDCTATLRTCVCIVTTNYVEDKYLQEEMGLRRFWPVKIGAVDQNALIRDRDQLFAEASVFEKDRGYLDIPEELQEQLQVEQKKRRFDPEFEDALSSIRGTPENPVLGRVRETITTAAIKDRFGLQLQHHGTPIDRKITQAMKRLGWEPVQLKQDDGRNLRGWERFVEEKQCKL